MMRKLLALGLLFAVIVAAGCGGMAKVEGVVTLDGKPVPGALVIFSPQGGTGDSADGFTDTSGKFTLATKGKAGVKAGTYKVTVSKADTSKEPMKPEDAMKMMKKAAPVPGGLGAPVTSKNELPGKYASADKTPLTVTIPPSESPIKIELSSK